MQQVKGSVLKSRLAFVEQNFGPEGLTRVLGALPVEDRRELARPLAIKWYPFEIGKRLDEAIVSTLANGDPAFFMRLGEASAEQNLSGVHASFLTPGDPAAFLAKSATIYRLYYETGRREYQPLGPREGLLITREAETFSQPDCLTVIGWYRRALSMCGAREVQIVEEECRALGGNVCRYHVRWQ